MNLIITRNSRGPISLLDHANAADLRGLPGSCEVWAFRGDDPEWDHLLLHGHPERVCAIRAAMPDGCRVVQLDDECMTARNFRGAWGAGTWAPVPCPDPCNESGGPL